ncbi:MAG: cytochrome c oxidase assembly protein [Dehalococcoidia bacterium]|nr:cytochrome c oxidase assembly protein [Dehalococcoidia bacterium]
MTIPGLLPYEPVLPAHSVIEGEWWQAWNFDPHLLLPVGLMAFFYLRGLTRWPARSRDHSPWRTASYLAGLVLVVLLYESPLDRLGEHHFSLHMVQHSLAVMIVPPLILLGAPTTPVLRGLPRGFRKAVVTPALNSRILQAVWGFLTQPVIAILLFSATMWAWHLMPGWYDRALNDRFVHDIQHVSFLVVGLIFWWNIVDPAPRRSRVPMGLRIVYFYGAMVPKHFLAAMITFADFVFYPTYEQVRLFLPGSPLQDQQLAGLLLWVPFGEAINLTTAAIIFTIWWRQSDRDQRAKDALRDAEIEAARDSERETAMATGG